MSDTRTAAAFASSWNNVGPGSVYTRAQFLDWMAPLHPSAFSGGRVLELGFGNGSLLCHMADYEPARLAGVELGDTIETTRRNLGHLPPESLDLRRGDLTQVEMGEYDLVYCIGVLHHLMDPEAGFRAVLRHTRPGGAFHCWVYAHEGNGLVRGVVDPLRRLSCKLPWWLTKYGVALPLSLPYYGYAKGLRRLSRGAAANALRHLPLYDYSQWIAARPFWFFHHVAFDQLVTPQTVYLKRAVLSRWLRHPDIEPGSEYLLFRNGNSWKFGGRRRQLTPPSG